jgi:D-alanine-D-alanine ligase
MNKDDAKTVLKHHGVGVAQGSTASRADIAKGGILPVPYVVKPNGSGSSASVYIVENETLELLAKMGADTGLGDTPVIERYIPGRELTVTVMNGRAMAVTEIIPEGWYSYAEKYGEGAARHELPAKIHPAAYALCMEWAETAHRALGCSGLTRTDFRFDDTGLLSEENSEIPDIANRVVTLELNTQPGMTPTSLAPEQAAYCGLSFGELCRWIIEDAQWQSLQPQENQGTTGASAR